MRAIKVEIKYSYCKRVNNSTYGNVRKTINYLDYGFCSFY